MTHLAVYEWGKVNLGEGPRCFTRAEANRLVAAARAHEIGGIEGANIVSDHHRYLRARQCVGVLASGDTSLEILPKVDSEAPDSEIGSVRAQLVHMLDAALDLGLSVGEVTPLARQSRSLLDLLIRIFANRLLAQARQGIPRQYQYIESDLPVLRGQLDVRRQFTVHSVRPDRLACRLDELSIDTPLMRIMRGCVIFLIARARTKEAQRLLAELRFLLDGVLDVPVRNLPWTSVYIDRSNRRWKTLYELAKLLLGRDWQSTHPAEIGGSSGISLLFKMNDLFEATVAKTLRHALVPYGFEVIVQGGFRYCLGPWIERGPCGGSLFRTRPDILIRHKGRIVAIVDTKWKCLKEEGEDSKRGISQADVYQLMAYAQLYSCDRLVLLYPHHSRLRCEPGLQATYGIAVPGKTVPDRLEVATIDASNEVLQMAEGLRRIILGPGRKESRRLASFEQ